MSELRETLQKKYVYFILLSVFTEITTLLQFLYEFFVTNNQIN